MNIGERGDALSVTKLTSILDSSAFVLQSTVDYIADFLQTYQSLSAIEEINRPFEMILSTIAETCPSTQISVGSIRSSPQPLGSSSLDVERSASRFKALVERNGNISNRAKNKRRS